MHSSVNLILLLAIFTGLMASGGARADERYRLYDIICVPEIHYFSLRSVDMYNSFGDWLSDASLGSGEADQATQEQAYHDQIKRKLQSMEEHYELFLPSRLQTRPYNCSPLPGITLEVSATAHSASTERCAGNGFDAIHVRVNGRLVDILGKINACDPDQSFSIRVNDLSYQVCVSEVGPEGVLSLTPGEGAFESRCRSLSLSSLR